MGYFRVIEFPASDTFYGDYSFRIPVVDSELHGVPQTLIGQFPSGSIDEIVADLNSYGFGSDFINLFSDLRYNNEPIGNPPNYEAAFLLHQVYPGILAVNYPQDTVITHTVKLYNSVVGVPTEASIVDANETRFIAHGDANSYALNHQIDLIWRAQYNYLFRIEISGIYTDQLNGNKFDFSGSNTDVARIIITCSRDSEDSWWTSIQILGGTFPAGVAITNGLNGHETDDAEQSSDDPYDDGGDSDSGGGGGSYDDDSDEVDFPDLPDISASDTGLISLYVPSATQIKDLANYMWNNNAFDVNQFKKLFADPMDAVIGLSIVPYAVPTSGAVTINVGNIPTGISMNKAAGQFFTLNCGSINLSEYFGSYLDYAPYTTVEIFLPYIGIRELKVDEMMAPKPGMTIHLIYHIDILSGACVAMIKCGDKMMYQFQGQCSTEIPFTGVEWGNAIKSAIDGATSVGNLVGGRGNPVNEVGALANSVMGCKPTVERSGHIGSAGGLLAGQHPYLIITRPRQCKPKNQNHYLGYPAFITENLGSIHGFTIIEECRLNNIKCNDEEMNEIMSLLKEGVIL